ncbi:MAG: hypothetical protein U5K69_03855 [Balneolaceae bacterium]|nr:hypothetical protein [Balneolaceae bacterium]
MSKSKDFTLGLISGALVGSVIALLYAPDQGKQYPGHPFLTGSAITLMS